MTWNIKAWTIIFILDLMTSFKIILYKTALKIKCPWSKDQRTQTSKTTFFVGRGKKRARRSRLWALVRSSTSDWWMRDSLFFQNGFRRTMKTCVDHRGGKESRWNIQELVLDKAVGARLCMVEQTCGGAEHQQRAGGASPPGGGGGRRHNQGSRRPLGPSRLIGGTRRGFQDIPGGQLEDNKQLFSSLVFWDSDVGIKDVLKVICPEMLGGGDEAAAAENLADRWEEAADFYLIWLFFCLKYLYKPRIQEKKPQQTDDSWVSDEACWRVNTRTKSCRLPSSITSRVYTKHHS